MSATLPRDPHPPIRRFRNASSGVVIRIFGPFGHRGPGRSLRRNNPRGTKSSASAPSRPSLLSLAYFMHDQAGLPRGFGTKRTAKLALPTNRWVQSTRSLIWPSRMMRRSRRGGPRALRPERTRQARRPHTSTWVLRHTRAMAHLLWYCFSPALRDIALFRGPMKRAADDSLDRVIPRSQDSRELRERGAPPAVARER